MKQLGFFNIILTVLIFLTLLVFPLFKTISANFSTAPRILNFFDKANVYNNASEIIKLEVQSYYPKDIKSNFILVGLANKLVDFVVTPNLVEQAAAPAVKLSVSFAKSPTSIVSDKVVISTAPYKSQVLNTISELGLPGVLVTTVKLAVGAVPADLTLVNLEKHPNSPLAMIIQARSIIGSNETLLVATSFFMLFLWIVLITYNLRHIKKLFESVWISVGFSAIIVFLVVVLVPWIVSLNLPGGVDSLGTAQNNLVMDVVKYFASQISKFAIWYAIIAGICFVAWKYIKFDKTQAKIDKVLKKLHIPTVEVIVKH